MYSNKARLVQLSAESVLQYQISFCQVRCVVRCGIRSVKKQWSVQNDIRPGSLNNLYTSTMQGHNRIHNSHANITTRESRACSKPQIAPNVLTPWSALAASCSYLVQLPEVQLLTLPVISDLLSLISIF
jgi:hypothetical protein